MEYKNNYTVFWNVVYVFYNDNSDYWVIFMIQKL